MILIKSLFLTIITRILDWLRLQSQFFVPHSDKILVGFDVFAFLLFIDNAQTIKILI